MKYMVFACGCKYSVDKIKRPNGGKRRCPDHGAGLVYGEIICVDCFELFKVSKMGFRADRCPDCSRSRALKRDIRRQKVGRRFASSCQLFNNIVYSTYEEIGKELGISKQAVEVIEKRALNKIRKQINKYPALVERLKEIKDIARVGKSYYKRNPVQEISYEDYR